MEMSDLLKIIAERNATLHLANEFLRNQNERLAKENSILKNQLEEMVNSQLSEIYEIQKMYKRS